MANTYSSLVTLDNLNTVYKDLRDRIGKIGNIYHIKGNITWANLLALTAASEGDVYNLIINTDNPGRDGDGRFKNGANVYCKKAFSSKLSNETWDTYWEVLDAGLEEATDDNVGLIKTGSTIKSSSSISEGNIVAGLKKRDGTTSSTSDNTGTSHDHQTYVEVPIATASTYGVITNQTQTIGGAKNFNSNLSVAGQLNLTGNFETTVNGINAQSIKVGDVTITASNGVITFS